MSTSAKTVKVITKPTIVQKASDSAAAVIAKTDSSQTLKDAAVALQTKIGTYNTAFDDFNGEVAVVTPKSVSVNADLMALKAAFTAFKVTAKGLVQMGLTAPADIAGIIMY